MKILITGAAGQVGWELQRISQPEHEIQAFDRSQLDICDPLQLQQRVADFQPDWIINASAYTAVDKAESEPEQAHAVNAEGAKNLARLTSQSGARLLHISTDFVFDGSQSHPYSPANQVCPLGVYGASKLAGEQAVTEILQQEALTIRTAWVYSAHGNNFVKTMLRLMNERDELGVVEDQVGTPTWAAELAKVIYKAIAADLRGCYHWTDSGVASWYDFAVASYEIGRAAGLIENTVTINPIPTTAYPLPAQRPAYSVLDKTTLRDALAYHGIHWRAALENMIKEINHV